ncbi:Splicing factor YJU2 [Pseudocercospora fuligena]|uniref:Splicing factor YJU2 n=1 Tax=Pseudocercospora fuligena TaxID=685502 RepID=A0A8H6RE30_9PEZI|nr:Splicing factor YJU2 [Pseudocercospora fuligena]
MSERKVLSKYYPPDFDPSKLERRRGPKQTGPKVQTVRLMAPFSMKCTSCGEFIYKGRKFNARKETTDEKYYNITILRFYIRCTRCSAEITFKTDPKNMDYTCERGAKRNFEVWREAKLAEETEEERLDRIQKEEDERDAMKDLEKKTLDAKTEMQIADALDDIRHRNAARARAEKDGFSTAPVEPTVDEEKERIERDLEEQARMAFQSSTGERVRRLGDELEEDDSTLMPPPAIPTFQRTMKSKKDPKALPGIKKKATEPATASTAEASKPVAAAPSPAPAAAPVVSLGLGDYDSD